MTATTRWIGLAVFIATCLGAGGLGAIATTSEIEGWYRRLEWLTERRLAGRKLLVVEVDVPQNA